MLNRAEGWRTREAATWGLALVSSVFFAVLLWALEGDLWLLAVILVPIWSPVIYQRYADDGPPGVDRRAIVGLIVGLAVLLCVVLLAYLAA